MPDIIKQDIVEKRIFLIRGNNVMFDRDLAELYQVETRVLNQAVKRNIDRFPDDFMFQLNKQEFKNWKSQIVMSNPDKMGLRRRPYVFTEQGVAMLSSVLNSQRAIQVNIAIMRVFVNIRKVFSGNREIIAKLNRLEDRVESQGGKISTIFDIMRRQSETKLLSPIKPFTNKKMIRDAISSCVKYIYWVDKYFSKAGLDWLSESLNTDKVKTVRILMLSEKVSDRFKLLYKDLKKELKSDKVKLEIRCITDKKVSTSIHDRWIIADNTCYNIPSTDTVARGQYTEIKRTINCPPFDKWWRKSQDIG